MAVLTKPVSQGFGFWDLSADPVPPQGTYVATCIDIEDRFGVERKKYQSEELEKADLTAFLFGFRDAQGNPHKIQSRPMKISGNEKSALYSFLRSWLGKAPEFGWDYCTLKGSKLLLTVDHEPRKSGDGVFPVIVSVSPVPTGFNEAPAPAAPPPAKPAAKAPSVASKKADPLPF